MSSLLRIHLPKYPVSFGKVNHVIEYTRGSYRLANVRDQRFFLLQTTDNMNNIRQVQALNKRELEHAVYVYISFCSMRSS
jgi:hypothetical protein